MNLNWIGILCRCVNETLWKNKCDQEGNKVAVFVSSDVFNASCCPFGPIKQ